MNQPNVTATAPVQIHDVGELSPGDLVEARRNHGVHYCGRVEVSAAALGVAWIRDDLGGHRVLLHLGHYTLWRRPLPEAAGGRRHAPAAGPRKIGQ